MPTILIVEDDEHIRTMLDETLREEGFETLLADNGLEGLRAFEEHAPDLVITDIHMPRKEGLSLITDLRRLAPKSRIIAISGGAAQLQASCNLELASMFGADCAFQKPLEIDSLLSAMNNLLRGTD